MIRHHELREDAPRGASSKDEPVFAWTGGGAGELRDVSKPIAFDEQGRPLSAPRGRVLRL